MNIRLSIRRVLAIIAVSACTLASHADKLVVCATVPDLGDLARTIGGDQVDVTVFAGGRQDPHFVIAKPSFIRDLNRADVFIQVGLDLETGWAPVLLDNARNRNVRPGTPGYIDASNAIEPMNIPTGPIDRSMGDVHGLGNPHYLLDPANGLRVAALIRDRFTEIKPEHKPYFHQRYAAFESLLMDKIKEWSKRMEPLQGTKAIGDHNMWSYFARRFGLEFVGFLEPKPGMSPTPRHINQLIELMHAQQVKLIVSTPYYDQRHAQFVARHTEAAVIMLAHQVEAVPGARDYVSMMEFNVRQFEETLGTSLSK